MDQATATVVTTSITAVSTLIAAFGGTLIGSSRTARKEKRDKRNTAVEEAVETILKIDHDLNDLYYSAVNRKSAPEEEILRKIRNISDQALRTDVLVRLYMPNLKNLLRLYNQNMSEFWNAVGRYNAKKVAKQSLDEASKEAKELQDTYKKTLSVMLEKMEKFVE